MDFGSKLRELRIERGWSQSQLAKGLGFRQTTISSWELGTNEPDFATVKKIADYFHVSPRTLIPFESSDPDEEIKSLAETIACNKKLKVLFDRTSSLSDEDLDAVIGVVHAISRERDADD